ncbi:hypothetical protein, partial [Salmonella sp. SAL4355]|uniref:hypothetical protein n=1 Tax=Salmonella sp. SAL4355 TaxID=3159876 RepID=UPI00397DDC32
EWNNQRDRAQLDLDSQKMMLEEARAQFESYRTQKEAEVMENADQLISKRQRMFDTKFNDLEKDYQAKEAQLILEKQQWELTKAASVEA